MTQQQPPMNQAPIPPYNPNDSKRMIAGIMGILLGGFGVHKFVLGFVGPGLIQIGLTFITCGAGSILGLIEGIIYLTKSDEQFYQEYIVNKKQWF